VHDPADGFTVPLRDLGDETPAWRGILAPVDASRDAPVGVTAQFLEHAADYHERYANVAHFRTVLDDAFARLERPPAPRTILDIGSGSGNSVIPLLDRFPDAFVVATDISAPLLAILRDHLAANDRYRGRFALVAVDAVDAPLRPASFDIRLPGRIVGEHRVVEDEGINELRRRRGHRPRLEGAVIQVVRTPFARRLRSLLPCGRGPHPCPSPVRRPLRNAGVRGREAN